MSRCIVGFWCLGVYVGIWGGVWCAMYLCVCGGGGGGCVRVCA